MKPDSFADSSNLETQYMSMKSSLFRKYIKVTASLISSLPFLVFDCLCSHCHYYRRAPSLISRSILSSPQATSPFNLLFLCFGISEPSSLSPRRSLCHFSHHLESIFPSSPNSQKRNSLHARNSFRYQIPCLYQRLY